MIIAPRKPVNVAIHRRQPTRSLSTSAESAVVITGETKITARASANGKAWKDKITSTLVASAKIARRKFRLGALLRRDDNEPPSSLSIRNTKGSENSPRQAMTSPGCSEPKSHFVMASLLVSSTVPTTMHKMPFNGASISDDGVM